MLGTFHVDPCQCAHSASRDVPLLQICTRDLREKTTLPSMHKWGPGLYLPNLPHYFTSFKKKEWIDIDIVVTSRW